MNEKNIKINLTSAAGEPSSPKTWSGTTYNVYNELKRNDYLGKSFMAGRNNYFVILWVFVLKAIYKIKDYRNHTFSKTWNYTYLRYLYAYSVSKATSSSGSKHTLHFSMLSMPFLKFPKKQFHYTYLDGTWNLWSKYATDLQDIAEEDYNNIEALENKAHQQATHIFTTGEHVKDNLVNHYKVAPQKITVVGTGTGIIKPFYGEKDYTNGKILFAAKGRFADKGGDLVLKAFELALKTNPNLHLSIVGQNEYTNTLKHSRITTYGFISVEELQELFNTHTLFVMPAINEPWGLVYIEAMLCKMPIIGLNRNSFPELSGYGKFGSIISEPDAEQLASQILSLTSDHEKMKVIGMQAQQEALKKFNWHNTVSRMVEVAELIERAQ